MGSDGRDAHPLRCGELDGHCGRQRPEVVAGAHELGEDAARQPDPLDERLVPLTRARVEQCRRRGVRRLGDRAAGEPVGHEVGDEQEAVGRG